MRDAPVCLASHKDWKQGETVNLALYEILLSAPQTAPRQNFLRALCVYSTPKSNALAIQALIVSQPADLQSLFCLIPPPRCFKQFGTFLLRIFLFRLKQIGVFLSLNRASCFLPLLVRWLWIHVYSTAVRVVLILSFNSQKANRRISPNVKPFLKMTRCTSKDKFFHFRKSSLRTLPSLNYLCLFLLSPQSGGWGRQWHRSLFWASSLVF